jgi:hypothetical protein
MKKFIYSAVILGSVLFISSSQAQFSAQKDAQHMATLRAVVDIKINDDEIASDIESLRQNQFFLRDLQKKLNKLSNTRTKNSTNKRVYDILLKAGQDIDRALR